MRGRSGACGRGLLQELGRACHAARQILAPVDLHAVQTAAVAASAACGGGGAAAIAGAVAIPAAAMTIATAVAVAPVV